MTTVSVVICAYTERRWDDLLTAIASARAGHPAELIVVIDHNPALAARLESAVDDCVILRNARRRGLSGARNTALDVATGEIIAFLDDDARAEPGWLDALLAHYEDAAVLAVGGAATPDWPARPVTLPAGPHGDPVRGELDWVVGCTYTGQPRVAAEVRNLMGCNMSFRRTVFERVGGFSEGIGRVGTVPLGCEETELCIRLRAAEPGARIVFEPAALVRHRVSADRFTWSYLRRRSYAEGVSKAVVSGLVGAAAALTTEKDYTRRVIPAGFLRELGRGNVPGALALVLSVLCAGFGYLRGSRAEPERVPGPPEPIALGELDLASPPARLLPGDIAARQARILVRDGSAVLGEVQLPLVDGEPAAGELATAVAALPRNDPPHAGFQPMVSVVIPSAGRPELAMRCARSVLATGYPKLEVLLVDNRPASAHAVPLREFVAGDDRLRYVPEPVAGASNARNRGAAEAIGEVIAFTDDDAVADPNWLAALTAEFAEPDVDCVTGLVLPLRLDTPAQCWFENWGGFGKGYHRRRLTAAGVTGEVGPDWTGRLALYPFAAGMFGSGNSMAWRAATFRALGGCDPLLGPGSPTGSGEDLELFVRLIRGGGTLVYTPHAVVRHEHRRELPDLTRQMFSYGTGLFPMFAVYIGRRPWEAVAVLRRLPAGIRHILAADSERNTGRGQDFPPELARAERRGVWSGPLRLAQALLTAPRHRLGLPEPAATTAQRAAEPTHRGRT